MVGWLSLSEERFWRPRWSLEEVRGLPLFRVEVSCPEGLAPRRAERRVRRGAALMARREIRRVLTAPEFPWRPILEEHGLRGVDPLPFCRAKGAQLVLALLEKKGIPAGEGSVCLRAGRVDRDLFRCASALCPLVRTVILDAPRGGASLAAWLRDEYGAAVPSRGRADVTAAFSVGEGDLLLYGLPDLGGLAPQVEGGALPPGADALALAALLWEEGRLPPEKLKFA